MAVNVNEWGTTQSAVWYKELACAMRMLRIMKTGVIKGATI